MIDLKPATFQVKLTDWMLDDIWSHKFNSFKTENCTGICIHGKGQLQMFWLKIKISQQRIIIY